MLIGLSGKAGSGKTTFADTLVKNHGFKKLNFAGCLKEEVINFLGDCNQEVSQDAFYGPSELREAAIEIPKEGMTDLMLKHGIMGITIMEKKDSIITSVRKLLQWWGTDYIRKTIPKHWSDILETEIKRHRIGSKLIIDDMRFPDEKEMIEKLGGKAIRIERPTLLASCDHASETALDNRLDWFYIFKNETNLVDYRYDIIEFFSELKGVNRV